MFLSQDTESSSAGSSQSSPFDTPLNRALNVMKNKDKLTKPTSAGRVAGKVLSTKWGSYYTAGVRKEKKTSSENQMREVEELKAQVARIPELVHEQVQQQLGTTLNAMVPTLIHGLTTWIAGGNRGLPRFPASRPATHTARRWRHWCFRRRHWCLRRRRHRCLRRRRYSCLWRRHRHWSLMHPGVRQLAPCQQAAPLSVARPPLAVP